MNTITIPTLRASGVASMPTRKERPPVQAGSRSTPTADLIRARAYQIYQARNGEGRAGDAASDWLQAEREIQGLGSSPAVTGEADRGARLRGDAGSVR